MEFNEHLKEMGVKVIHEEVTSLEQTNTGFLVNGEKFSHVVLATGTIPKELNIPKALYFIDKPSALEKKDVIIIGGGDFAYDNAVRIRQAGANVTILLRGETKANLSLLEEARKLGIKEIRGDLKEMMFDGEFYRFDYVKYHTAAIFIGRESNRSLIEDLGEIKVDLPSFSTSIKGLYIVGDAALGTLSQTALASGSGLAAAMHIAQTVRSQ
jgi:thioredoxin reductase